MYKPNPIFIKDDFYAVEATGWLPVNKSGEYLDKDGKPSKGYLEGFYKYKKYDIYRNNKKDIGFLHRAIALTFLDCPGDVDEYIVNHKDGNKENNALDNLEWATLSENIIHAYKTGLRTDNRRIKCRNVKTREELSFYSLTECARYFEVNQGSITKYLQRKNLRYPWKGVWELIYEGDSYPGITEDELDIHASGIARKIIAIQNDKGVIFQSAGLAASAVGVTRAALLWYLNGNASKGSRICKGYEWWFLSEYLENKKKLPKNTEESNEKIKYNKNPTKRKPSPVKVINLSDGTEETFESLYIVADKIGLKKNTLEKNIKLNDGVVYGRKFIYLNKTKQYR